MTITTRLTDGITNIDLVYNGTSQLNYKQMYGTQVASNLPSVIQHTPDFGAPEPIDGWDGDRQVFLELDVIGDDFDTILNKVAILKRMVDGASSQALRYWTVGDVRRVNLQLGIGQTNTTSIPVKFGLVDDSAAYYTGDAYLNTRARRVIVSLIVAPYGEGDEIVLNNELANPAFLIEGSTAGLAATWGTFGTVTTALDTANYLIGGASQKATITALDAGLGGIRSASIVATSTDVAAFVWVSLGAGSTNVAAKIYDDTVGANIVLVNVTAANASAIVTDSAGATWYKIDLSTSSAVIGNDIQLHVRTTEVGEVFYMDGAYLEQGTTAVPDAWASSKSLQNRNDFTATNPQRINYIDVWGVPGDADALVNWYFTSTNTRRLWASSAFSGRATVQDEKYWLETLSGSGAQWSAGTDGTRAYYRYTDNDSEATSVISGSVTAANISAMSGKIYRYFAIARATNVGYQVKPFITGNYGEALDTDYVSFTVTNTWVILDLGRYSLTERNPRLPAVSGANFGLTLNLDDVAGGGTNYVDIDCVILMPVQQFAIVENTFPSGTAYQALRMNIRGDFQEVYGTNSAVNVPDFLSSWLGNFWLAKSGQVETRGYFLIGDDANNSHSVARDSTVQLTITPRTRHILGTQ